MALVPDLSRPPMGFVATGGGEVLVFQADQDHRDERTIASFGEEWEKFNAFADQEIEQVGEEYFDVVPDALFGPGVLALDMGCGSGRWARYLSRRVGRVEALDPSDAIFHAAARHGDLHNVRWSQAGVDGIPFTDGTFDLVICLGVLHHVPDTGKALSKLAAKLRPGGHLLLYLYYALDGRGPLFSALFRMSDALRRLVSGMPGRAKRITCDILACTVYLPLRTLVRIAKGLGMRNWKKLPLAYYHDKSLTILRNDALDRFGTPLEQRFTKDEMERMMHDAGLAKITFSAQPPYWHAIGQRTGGGA